MNPPLLGPRCTRTLFLALAIICAAPGVLAQLPQASDTTSPPTPGVGHDYLHAPQETVNPANGSVSIRIPVRMPEGRELTIPFNFAYDSNGAFYYGQKGNTVPQYLPITTTAFAKGGWSYTVPLLTSTFQGWTAQSSDGKNLNCSERVNYVFQDPTGNRHNLGLAINTSNPNWMQWCGGTGDSILTGGEGPILATGTQGSFPPVVVTDGNGTVYSFGTTLQSVPSSITDRNGNSVSVSYNINNNSASVTDTVGRTAINIPTFGSNPDTITIAGLSSLYDVYWTTASASFTISVYNLPGSSGCSTSLSATSGVASQITLPNGQKYTFTYDPTYGMLTKIVYPSGGYVRYVWGLNSQAEFFGGATYDSNGVTNGVYSCRYDSPAVTDRYVSFDGSTEALHQHFFYSTSWSGTSASWTTKTTTVTTYDLVRSTNFNTVYTYTPFQDPCVPDLNPNANNDGCLGDNNAEQVPYEEKIQYYGTNGSLLRTVTKGWYFANQYSTQRPTLDSVQTTLDNNQSSLTVNCYNTSQEMTETDEYDLGTSTPTLPTCAQGVPSGTVSGSLLRKAVTNYATFTGTNIVDLPSSVITYDGSGNRVAETDSSYDQSSLQSTSVTQHGSAPGGTARGNLTTVTKQCFNGACAGGNPTTKYTYYDTGQIYQMTDPCGNATCSDMSGSNHVTAYSYTDNYTVHCSGSAPPNGATNAYLTQVTYPPTSGVNHIESKCYDYAKALLLSSTDQNSQTTTYAYADSLDRLTQTGYPDGGQTTYSYNDTPPTPTLTTQKLISSGNYLTSVATMNGLGAATETQLTSDPEGTDSTATTYDGLGRVYKQYNATRCSPPTTNCGTDPTWGMTTTVYDALGRTTIFVPQDGTVPTGSSCPSNDVCTSYSGNTTTATDEAGISRKSVTDGLGRLKQVFEAPSGVNYETDYAYDALDNLLCVAQKGTNSGTFTNCASTPASWRPRSFAYDSLSRLTSSQNPEISSPTTGSACAVSYSYDANGNLASKISPEPNQTSCSTTLSTSFSYDNDNRMAEKSYSDSTLPAYFYYDQTSGSGFTLSNTIGRLSSEGTYTGSSWLTAAMIGYDSMGRTNLDAQCTTANASSNWCSWAPTYVYNQIGGITSYGNSAGTTLSQTFDNAGRPTQLTSSWSDSGHPATLVTVASNVGYWPHGPLRLATFANGLTEDTLYNPRLQLCRMNINSWDGVLTTCTQSATGSNIDFTMSYNYGTGDNGNIFNMSAIGGQTFNRTYTYDSENRISTMTDSATGQPCKGLQWTIDAWGNRTAQSTTSGSCITSPTLTVNNNNQITGSPYQYDAAGNMTHDASHSYTYDAENHLISVDGGSTATYVYDAEGRRVEKTSGGVTLNYTYDLNGSVLAERSSSCSYCLTTGYNYFDGALNSIYTSSTTYFVHTDHLGSTRLATGYPTPNTVECDDYYPYGELNTSGCSQSAAITHKFTSKERDAESGLDNFGARYNSSQLGRFMSPNPIGGRQAFPQSWNAYAYVLNNPLNAVDPTGLDCVYLNDAGNGIESIDQNSNAGECQQNGGAWADGTITNVTFDPNSNDVLLGYANMGNNGNIDYSQITATPGQFNPGDEIYGLANDINQMNLTSNIFKIYGAGAAVGATGGTACYVFCGSLGIGTVTTLGATVGGTAGPLVTDPRLQNIVNWLFQGTDELPGGTAGAVTYEQKMGDLLSQAGHMQKAQDAIAGLNDLLKSGALSFNDQLAARQMIQQLQTAVATKPFGQN